MSAIGTWPSKTRPSTTAVWQEDSCCGTPRACWKAARERSSMMVTGRLNCVRTCSAHFSQQPQPGSRWTRIGVAALAAVAANMAASAAIICFFNVHAFQ